MRPIKSIALVFAFAMVAAAQADVTQPAKQDGGGGRTIILFGASWCVPCRDELRRIGALAKEAAPDRVRIAWLDRLPPVAASALPANVSILSVTQANMAFERIVANPAGLPVSVMLERETTACAIIPRALTKELIGIMRQRCAARGAGLHTPNGGLPLKHRLG